MKAVDIRNVEIGKKYILTKVYSEECKDKKLRGKVERFEATITWIEDRDSEYYFGYKPTIQNPYIPGYICAFGTFGIKKYGTHKCINMFIEEVE